MRRTANQRAAVPFDKRDLSGRDIGIMSGAGLPEDAIMAVFPRIEPGGLQRPSGWRA
jgi:hypothetical protein